MKPVNQSIDAGTGAGAGDGVALRRVLSLPMVVLYGLGVTIGAGIYVLLGATAGRAGIHAPAAFLLAAVTVLFSALSFAELSRRFPVSAGEAAYVKAGFNSSTLSLLVGLLVVFSGVVSSAAVARGAVGYISVFLPPSLPVPEFALLALVIVALGLVTAWGIGESIIFAAIFTLVEVGALLVVLAFAFGRNPDLVFRLTEVIPAPGDFTAWSAVSGAALLAFFAFIGFEDIVNLAEETREPRRTLPHAIFWTLGLATLLYVLVVAVAVLSTPLDALANSETPMSLVFAEVSGFSPWAITLIAILATLNGVIVQIIMASRVLYGLARQKLLPAFLGAVNPVTRTPLIATGLVVMVILILALPFPIETLAEWSSRVILTSFAMVNASLFRILIREAAIAHLWKPGAGFLTSVALLIADLL